MSNIYTKLVELAQNKNYKEFCMEIPRPLRNNIAIEITDYLCDKLTDELLFSLASYLIIRWDKANGKIGDKLLVKSYKRSKDDIKEKIYRLCNHNSWGVRESAAKILSVIVTYKFDEIINWLESLVNDRKVNIRRAIVLASKYSVQERIPNRAEKLLDLIEPLNSDRAEYVRKNFGPFTIGDGFLRIYPEVTIPYLRKWSKEDNEQIRWNVARAFSSSGGKANWKKCFDILEELAKDERRYVWKAVSTTLQYLYKKNEEEVSIIVDSWLLDDEKKIVAEDVMKFVKKNRSKDFI